ncbi:probable serine hydrolase [Episyrphus balteatus]|uniref:probable serine hydrolase n=1 Tax=Episyrphus balteatus TaxID=286459 RepID=UPI00248576FE|nr:probable serine hydrolase [Episyrphus balteatus]
MRTASVVLSFLQRSLQVQGPFRKSIKSFSTYSTTREFEEIQVSVPWGHIAGKWYGPKDKRPLVGFHGWQDNAGTFDTLAPLLPQHIGFLSIDLPGHGLSSWLPHGSSYHSIDQLNIYFRLMNEFKWDKISMISHSMSAADGFVFTSLFPDKCDLFIAVDLVQPLLGKKELSIKMITDQFESYNKQIELSLQKSEPPTYEFDKLVERMTKANGDSILREYYELILKRNIKPSKEDPNKYYFSRDPQLKSMSFTIFPNDILVEMAHKITCPHLFITAKRARHYDSEEELKEVMDAFRKNPHFENHVVDGTHYVHLNEPHKIAEIVNPFIMKYRPE